MYHSTKSEFIKCLASDLPVAHTSPKAYVITLDGAFIVQTRNGYYADEVFIPFLLSYLRDACRIDVVWDSYKTDSIKHDTQELNGCGICEVTLAEKNPSSRHGFLYVDEYKEELFDLLAQKKKKQTNKNKKQNLRIIC